mgnify:CR=1 FL=1
MPTPPYTAQTSRPWRIHGLTHDFRLEDVWALPTPGGPRDFHWLVQSFASSDPSRGSLPGRALWAVRWKLGELLGWDGPDTGVGTPRDLPLGVEVALYRLTQEALTNVLKHAGPEAHASVRIAYGPTDLAIAVTDDGPGVVDRARLDGDSGEQGAGCQEARLRRGYHFHARHGVVGVG